MVKWSGSVTNFSVIAQFISDGPKNEKLFWPKLLLLKCDLQSVLFIYLFSKSFNNYIYNS